MLVARAIASALASHISTNAHVASRSAITTIGALTTTTSAAPCARTLGPFLIDARHDTPSADGASRQLRDDTVGDVGGDLHERMILANVDFADLRTRYVSFIRDRPNEVTRPRIVHRADIHEDARHRARCRGRRRRRYGPMLGGSRPRGVALEARLFEKPQCRRGDLDSVVALEQRLERQKFTRERARGERITQLGAHDLLPR